jgi:hypothetical protein
LRSEEVLLRITHDHTRGFALPPVCRGTGGAPMGWVSIVQYNAIPFGVYSVVLYLGIEISL